MNWLCLLFLIAPIQENANQVLTQQWLKENGLESMFKVRQVENAGTEMSITLSPQFKFSTKSKLQAALQASEDTLYSQTGKSFCLYLLESLSAHLGIPTRKLAILIKADISEIDGLKLTKDDTDQFAQALNLKKSTDSRSINSYQIIRVPIKDTRLFPSEIVEKAATTIFNKLKLAVQEKHPQANVIEVDRWENVMTVRSEYLRNEVLDSYFEYITYTFRFMVEAEVLTIYMTLDGKYASGILKGPSFTSIDCRPMIPRYHSELINYAQRFKSVVSSFFD